MPAPAKFEYRSYASGMNAAVLPTGAIRADELALVINGTVRSGYLRTRPGWHWQPVSFMSPDAQLIFENGKYQGSEPYFSERGNVMTYCVDGSMFIYQPVSGIIEKSTPVPAFSKYSQQVWMKQRSKWMIAQDGVSPPLVSDGNTITQEMVPEGIPIGTIMAEGWHRLVVVDSNRRRIFISDHEMDPTSTPISFTESTDYFANARYIEGPPSLGRIMGASFIPYRDSSTGIGPLVVFFERGTRAYDIGIPRSQWIAQDISATIFPRIGSSTFGCYADRGNQLLFRDQDGRIRTLQNAQQVEAVPATFPTDFAIWPLIKGEDATLRTHSQAVTFDGRTMVLTHPERVRLADGRYAIRHRGIAVMENEHLSDRQDVWSFWTGMNVCGFDVLTVDGEEMLIAFCRDSDNKNRLYRLTRDGDFDITPIGGGMGEKRIRMTLATPAMDFGAPVNHKTLTGSGIRMSGMRGRIDVCGRWQADGKQPADWFTHSELHPQCMVFGDCCITEMGTGSNHRLAFPTLPEFEKRFYKGGMVLDIFGPATLEEMIMDCAIQEAAPVTSVNGCGTPKEVRAAQAACAVDLFAYDAFLAPSTTPTTLKPCP